jgi:hypothetical protein
MSILGALVGVVLCAIQAAALVVVPAPACLNRNSSALQRL